MTHFKYETHCHTSETSACGKSTGAELAAYFHALGYTGVFVTDHFLNGNTTVTDDLPWHERVTLFSRGYEMMAEQGARLGLDVFFAWEYSYGWAHFMTYGLSRDWLHAYPDMLEWDVLEYFDRVRADGGTIVHAHPFREKVEIIQLIPGKVDAIEVVNPGRPDDANQHALDFALSFGLPQTAGSDIHSVRSKRLCGIATYQRLSGGRDYADAIISGKASLFDEDH